MLTLGHLSDLHTTPVFSDGALSLLNKRFFGWLSWNVRRKQRHRPEVLRGLIADLHAAAPDEVVVTGDLTNVALPHEFSAARDWLERIGEPERVFLVPGNHDAYVSVPRDVSWHLWKEYLAGDAGMGEFPTLRVRDSVAIVGLCSAHPTPLFQANGTLGEAQIARLDVLLADLAERGLCRVVLVHHPVAADLVSQRRALLDGEALREVLARRGAELVLHGHTHRGIFTSVPGPEGDIPVVGVRSASDVGDRPERCAQYHLYDIEGANGCFQIRARIRGLDPETGEFIDEGERAL